MLADDALRDLLTSSEAANVERTASIRDRDKWGEAICAFGNDLPDLRRTGVLFIGIRDDGTCANATIDEQLIQTLLGFRSDGSITPFPVMSVRRHQLDGCALAIVEVEPSENPPLKYKGRVCVRSGPRRAFATPEEERRLTEKRRWGNLPFDQQPIQGTSIRDLDLLRFQEEFLRSAIAPDVLAENGRNVEDQLRAVRFLTPDGRATTVGLLVCGRDSRTWIPGAYLQFVRYPGQVIGDVVRDHKEIDGCLSDQLRRLDEIIDANIENRADLSAPTQRDHPTYPAIALRELARNAIIHRNYEGTAAPVRLTWYDNRIEITSPGGPYGMVTADTFGREGVTDYRNPAIGDAAKALGFIQRFGSGIPRARAALMQNGNAPLEFNIEPTYVNVVVRTAP